MRAIVHKTKGKLDLRSLTVFGLNAKPTTDTPIGYFGTGLKYAIAVLARSGIATTFWIDGKKWTVEQDDTKFRDKTFRALSLKRHTFVSKTVNLPFTTELGKNWGLWQAFRELEANTRDEKGETFQMHNAEGEPTDIQKMVGEGFTAIVVEGEGYVQEYLDRNKTFLPDGLTARDGTERIQVFTRKSNWVYYRGIRILDLKEPSENTYNILAPVILTEDRTCKSEFDIRWEIQNYLGASNEPEIIKRAVTAPPKSFERALDYDYSLRSKTFLDTASSVGENATEHVKSILRRDRPPQRPTETYTNWIRDLIAAIQRGDNDRVVQVIHENETEAVQILETAAQAKEKEDVNNSQRSEPYLDTELVDRNQAGSPTGRCSGNTIQPTKGSEVSYILDPHTDAQEVKNPEPDIHHGIDDISARKDGYDDIPF